MSVVLLSAARRISAATVAAAMTAVGAERGDFVLVSSATPAGTLPPGVDVIVVADPDARSRRPSARALRLLRRHRVTALVPRLLRGGPPRAFLRAVRTSDPALAAVRGSAAVVVLDSPALRAAWWLARRHPQVRVVQGTAGLSRLEDAERL